MRGVAIVAVLGGFVGAYVTIAEKRADYLGGILSRNLVASGSAPLTEVWALPLKGCGWTFGETVWGWTEMAGVRTRVLMCRNRNGVRIDVTTYESQWIRGGDR